jgi:hypothetical protein
MPSLPPICLANRNRKNEGTNPFTPADTHSALKIDGTNRITNPAHPKGSTSITKQTHRRLHRFKLNAHARRSRKLFATTDTLDNAIAADAIIGDSIQPVHG